MARKSKSVEPVEEGRKRQLCDYVFEDHRDDGTVNPIGITLHYPTDIDSVRDYLVANSTLLGILGELKVCKKVYS